MQLYSNFKFSNTLLYFENKIALILIFLLKLFILNKKILYHFKLILKPFIFIRKLRYLKILIILNKKFKNKYSKYYI